MASYRAFCFFRVNAFENAALAAAKWLHIPRLGCMKRDRAAALPALEQLPRPSPSCGTASGPLHPWSPLSSGWPLGHLWGFGKRVGVLALGGAAAALLKSVRVLVDFSLLPIGRAHISSALSKQQLNMQNGRK